MLEQLTPLQWIVGALAALVAGVAKTGVPGVSILVVPLMAAVFPAKLSVGTLLPMLITADLFAVTYHRRHVDWGQLAKLVPAVLVGMAGGLAFLLSTSGDGQGGVDWFKATIGGVVLLMLAVHLLRLRFGDRFAPRSRLGVVAAGAGSGFATTIANAAGPVMNVYLAGMGFSKERFMGTMVWFFFLVNLAKIPLFVVVGLVRPGEPMITGDTLLYDACMIPPIVLGAFAGMWLFKRIPQRWFGIAVLVLAGLAAAHLVIAAFFPYS